MLDVNILVGQTLTSVKVNENRDEIIFTTDKGHQYKLWHSQDCCEVVSIDDIYGNLDDLVGSPILVAEVVTSHDPAFEGPYKDILLRAKFAQGNPVKEPEYQSESFTWTFYKFRTLKGSVDIRWYSSSNGYYSEKVTFEEHRTF